MTSHPTNDATEGFAEQPVADAFWEASDTDETGTARRGYDSPVLTEFDVDKAEDQRRAWHERLVLSLLEVTERSGVDKAPDWVQEWREALVMCALGFTEQQYEVLRAVASAADIPVTQYVVDCALGALCADLQPLPAGGLDGIFTTYHTLGSA